MGRLFCYTLSARAIGATVSAGALHAQGWGFESLIAHHLIDKAPSDGGLSFLGPSHGIRTRQGAELRKRASVFQRSTRGPKARSGSGRRSRTRTSLIAHHLVDKAPSDGGLSFLGPSQRDSNPAGCIPLQGRRESIAKTSSGSLDRAVYGTSATRSPFQATIFARARPKRPTGSRSDCPRRSPRRREAAGNAAYGHP